MRFLQILPLVACFFLASVGVSYGQKDGPTTPPAKPTIDRKTIAAWKALDAQHDWLGIFRDWGLSMTAGDTAQLIAPMEELRLSKDSLAKLPKGLKGLPEVSVPFMLNFGDIPV